MELKTGKKLPRCEWGTSASRELSDDLLFHDSLLNRMNTFSPELRHSFEAVLDWLKQWSCAHSYCLGSRLPWDPQFLVESLSDSSVYMAYYTVSHLLQGGIIFGDKQGRLNVPADHMTDEVWRYILQDGPFPRDQAIDVTKAARLKESFQFFYPLDLRSSGKDLIPNHLAFCIYNHAALFKEEHWPKAMRANGYLLLDGQKMSKSTGNFLTLSEALKKFGADATRLTLADAGDDMTDAKSVKEPKEPPSISRSRLTCSNSALRKRQQTHVSCVFTTPSHGPRYVI